MIYSLGDKFVVQGVLCEVRYINRGKAWVSPLEDIESSGGRVLHFKYVSFNVLDEKGRDKSGYKALVVNNSQSGAV